MYLIPAEEKVTDDAFWDFLDTSEERPENDRYSYKKAFDISGSIENVLPEIRQAGVIRGCACHYRNRPFPWHAPKFSIQGKPIVYMIRHQFLNHTGAVVLETFPELESFFRHLSHYPTSARYLDIYVICGSFIFEISHHNHIFLYQIRY